MFTVGLHSHDILGHEIPTRKHIWTLILSVDPSLLYLIENSNPSMEETHQLVLEKDTETKRGRLCSGTHKSQAKIFDALSVARDPVTKQDQAVASLPESYDMLVTALEANAEVPGIGATTKRREKAPRLQDIHCHNGRCEKGSISK